MIPECHIRVREYDIQTLKPQRIVQCVEKSVSKPSNRVQ